MLTGYKLKGSPIFCSVFSFGLENLNRVLISALKRQVLLWELSVVCMNMLLVL